MTAPRPRSSTPRRLAWCLALAGFLGLLLWYFDWPVSFEEPESGRLVEQTAPPGTGGGSAESGPASEGSDSSLSETDAEVFAGQSEPPVQEGSTDDSQLLQIASRKESGGGGDDGRRLPENPQRSPFEPPGETEPSGRKAETDEGSVPPEDGSNDLASVLGSSAEPRGDEEPGRLTPVKETATPGSMPSEARERLEEIDEILSRGEELVAHRELSTLYWVKPDWRPYLRKRIEKTAEGIYFSPQPHYMQPYVVESGDKLAEIAEKYNVPWQYLARLNRIDPRRIQAGDQLKVIKGPFAAQVDLSDFEMTIHAHGYFVSRYRVGIGRDGTTPIGKFTVLKKLVNPTYYGPEGNVVDADDPENPLGERWIDLGDGYGIHGTIDPQSIGRSMSRGCIRLHNSDVEEVFDLLSVGSEVTIRR